MIRSLYIKNFAIVDEIQVEFGKGLNIITGETGAGKSILINALAQLCGERGHTDLVRNGEKKAVIEAVFDVRPHSGLLRLAEALQLEIDDYSQIVIRKEISANGNSRTFVNDSPVTLSRLQKFSAFLLDLHGQHQHQRLLHPENHLDYLDSFGAYEKTLSDFAALLKRFKKQSGALEALKAKQIDSYQKQDMYKYQIEELSRAELQEEELETLTAELKILANIEGLHQMGGILSETLYTGDENAANMLASAEENLGRLEKLDEKFSGLRQSLAAARDTVEEIGRFTEQYLAELEFSPDRMEFIHQRTAQIEFLLKKYQRNSTAELLQLQDEIQELINDTEQFDDRIQEYEKELAQTIAELNSLGAVLSRKRNETATHFEKEILVLLGQLGMAQARFRVRMELNTKEGAPFSCSGQSVAANAAGFDKIVFEMASNPGDMFTPIHKTASGGEISRLMLAIKSVLAEADKIPSLVFDEIDAGISGKTAQAVGAKLFELSRFHQILCVTHLPQIASFADKHYKAAKYTEDNRTFADIRALDSKQREVEIANLLGGKNISQQAV